jgi:AbrB family looped-hinge helix DNA binding protein
MTSVVVTRNFQITIPKSIRDYTGIEIGDSVIIEAKDNEITLKKVNDDPIKAAFGRWRWCKDSIEYVDKLRSTWDER